MISLKHLWIVDEQHMTPWQKRGIGLLRRIDIVWQSIMQENMLNYAAALTYSSLMAAVPVLAIIFAVARGFGFDAIIESELRESLHANQEIADTVIYFVDAYLQHTRGGIFIGIGLVFLLWSIYSLTNNIENAFNTIWHIRNVRSIQRRMISYVSIFVFIPFFVVITSGLNMVLQTVRQLLPDYMLFSTTMSWVLSLSPALIAVLAFITLYHQMPNTPVKFRHTLWPGIAAGLLFMLTEWLYIHYQIKLSSYNAIYGSFAAIPLFMVWMQISWTICLGGAVWSYANQNLETYAIERYSDQMSRRYRDTIMLLLMCRICKRFKSGQTPYTDHKLAQETLLPFNLVRLMLSELVDMGLLMMDASGRSYYVPAIDPSLITISKVIRSIDRQGEENLSLYWQHETPEWPELRMLRYENGDKLLTDL